MSAKESAEAVDFVPASRLISEGCPANRSLSAIELIFMNGSIATTVSPGVLAQLFLCASATETAVMLIMPRAVTEGVRIWAGLAAPIRIGPTGRVSAMIIVIV
jgi:hypothetical protein